MLGCYKNPYKKEKNKIKLSGEIEAAKYGWPYQNMLIQYRFKDCGTISQLIQNRNLVLEGI